MNIFKKLTLTVALGLVVVSCTEDAKRGITLPATESGEATLTLEDNVFAPNASASFSFALPQAYDKPARVTVSALSSEFVERTATVDVPAGQTTGTGMITLPNTASGNVIGTYTQGAASFATLKINGAVPLKEEVDTNGNVELVPDSSNTLALTSNEVTVDVISRLPGFNADGYNYVMDWEDPTNVDLDLQVIDAAFTSIFESSGSLTRFESDLFNNTHPDGDYVFYVRIWETPNPTTAPIEYTIHMINPQGVRTSFTSTLPAGSPAGGSRIPVATLNKVNGNEYTFAGL